MSEILLGVDGLSIGIKNSNGFIPVVDSINFHIKKSEIFGIVGESGCGKSLTALSVAGLLPEGIKIISGKVIFEKTDLTGLKKEEMRKIQGKDISMIFQEPLNSLNPLMKIGRQVSENLRLHTKMTQNEVYAETVNLFKKVGLPKPKELMNYYPHQLSGGMRQRVMIAMAVICKPKLIIADEPTSALDVTIQAQVLELLRHINSEYGCAILFISHDLGVISQLCGRTAVMYAGSIVEEGSTRNIFFHPAHEYTKGLIGSIPSRDKRGKRLVSIPGKVPAITDKKYACPFAPRCSEAQDKCFLDKPKAVNLSLDHTVSCVLAAKESGGEDAGI